MKITKKKFKKLLRKSSKKSSKIFKKFLEDVFADLRDYCERMEMTVGTEPDSVQEPDDVENFQYLIGMTVKDAEDEIKNTPHYFVAIEEDGEKFAIAEMIDYNRIQVTVEKGIITEINDVR